MNSSGFTVSYRDEYEAGVSAKLMLTHVRIKYSSCIYNWIKWLITVSVMGIYSVSKLFFSISV